MRKASLTARKPARELIAVAIACLFLLQTIAFVFSLNGRTVFSTSPQGVALSMAGELCDADANDGGKAPAQHHHHQHCASCGVSNRSAPLDAVAFIAAVVVLTLPQSEASPARVHHDELKPPSEWKGAWSSRAPPSFS